MTNEDLATALARANARVDALTLLVQDLMDALYGLDAPRACKLFEQVESRVAWTERSRDAEADPMLIALRILEPTLPGRAPLPTPHARRPFVRAAR